MFLQKLCIAVKIFLCCNIAATKNSVTCKRPVQFCIIKLRKKLIVYFKPNSHTLFAAVTFFEKKAKKFVRLFIVAAGVRRHISFKKFFQSLRLLLTSLSDFNSLQVNSVNLLTLLHAHPSIKIEIVNARLWQCHNPCPGTLSEISF